VNRPAAVRLRVWVPDVWDVVDVSVAPSTSVADVKAVALRQAAGRSLAAHDYQVKFRGALLTDERRTMADLGARDGTPLIVLPARRRPVR